MGFIVALRIKTCYLLLGSSPKVRVFFWENSLTILKMFKMWWRTLNSPRQWNLQSTRVDRKNDHLK